MCFGQDSSVLTELGELSTKAVSIPGHLQRNTHELKNKLF